MRISSTLPVWIVCLGCCLLVPASGRTSPVDVASADLDVSVYDSSEVVKGRVVGWPSRGSSTAATVELIAVCKGDLKPGQVVTVLSGIIDRFYVEYRAYGSQRSFERGDEIFLFLNPHRPGPSEHLPGDGSYHDLVRVKLVRGNQVLAFQYFDMPIRLELTEPKPGDNQPPVVEEYREAIARSIPEMEKLRERFASKPSIEDRTWLLELLRQHLPQQSDDYDTLETQAENRIAKLHDLPLLNEAAALPFPAGYIRYLGSGYDFPAGREYLLKQIADRKVAMDMRIKDALLLADAGWPDDSPDRKESSSGKRTGHRAKIHVPYLTRLAGYAWDLRGEPEICLMFLYSLRRLAQDSSSGLGGGKDLAEAKVEVAPIMREIVGSAKTDEIKDEAQQVVANLHR